MHSGEGELCQSVRSAADQFSGALRRAAAKGLGIDQLTQLLKVAFSGRNRIDAALSEAVGALDTAVEDSDGTQTLALSCTTWISHNLHISNSSAAAQVHLARRLPSLPATSSAFADGELSALHVSVVSRIVEQVERAEGDRELAETLMLQEAEHGDPRALLRWGFGLVHRLAPDEMEAEEERRHRRRYLHLSEVFDGGYEIEAYLDPECGATLKTALNGILGPRAKGDERSPGQRRADGLGELARRGLDSGELPVRGGQKPHLTITASIDTLCGNPGAPAALLDWGWPISGKALRRIAADAVITPILVDGKGDPLHVGRKYRTVQYVKITQARIRGWGRSGSRPASPEPRQLQRASRRVATPIPPRASAAPFV